MWREGERRGVGKLHVCTEHGECFFLTFQALPNVLVECRFVRVNVADTLGLILGDSKPVGSQFAFVRDEQV